MKSKIDRELIDEYISLLIRWFSNNSRRGDVIIRRKIEKLGNELVKRDLLTQEKADKFYHGDF